MFLQLAQMTILQVSKLLAGVGILVWCCFSWLWEDCCGELFNFHHLLRQLKEHADIPLILELSTQFLFLKTSFSDEVQTAHEVTDMQEQLNVEHDRESDIVPNMTRDSRVKYITYYEDGISLSGKRTAVWELDKSTSVKNWVNTPIAR